MPELELPQSQMMLLAGMILMGWVLIRRQLKGRARERKDFYTENISQDSAERPQVSPGVPLASAPAEARQWAVEMLDLQRELKAELDMKIAVVESLLRQADRTLHDADVKLTKLAAMQQQKD